MVENGIINAFDFLYFSVKVTLVCERKYVDIFIEGWCIFRDCW